MKEKERTSAPVETSPAKKAGGTCCGGSPGARLAIVVILLLAGFTVLGYTGVFDGLLKKSSAEGAKAAGVTETADAVKIPLKALDPGKALFLSLESEGRRLYYFALKSKDGAYRAALDTCDVCFRTNRGDRQGGAAGVMVIRKVDIVAGKEYFARKRS